MDVLASVNGSAGIVSNVARRMVCDWHTARDYVEKWESTRQAFAGELEMVLDMAELKLISKVKRGTAWALKFYLATKGKGRGYTKRQELTGADGEPIRAVLHTPEQFDTPEAWAKHVATREGSGAAP